MSLSTVQEFTTIAISVIMAMQFPLRSVIHPLCYIKMTSSGHCFIYITSLFNPTTDSPFSVIFKVNYFLRVHTLQNRLQIQPQPSD